MSPHILPYESCLQKLVSQRATSPAFSGRSIGRVDGPDRASSGHFAKNPSVFRKSTRAPEALSVYFQKTPQIISKSASAPPCPLLPTQPPHGHRSSKEVACPRCAVEGAEAREIRRRADRANLIRPHGGHGRRRRRRRWLLPVLSSPHRLHAGTSTVVA